MKKEIAGSCFQCEQEDIILDSVVCIHCDYLNRKNDYLQNDGTITINKDNIHLYYEFMSDEDLIEHSLLLITGENELRKRMLEVGEILNLQKDGYGKFLYSMLYGQLRCENGFKELKTDYGVYILKYSFFGVKDTLKPIEEYIEEIKTSNEYKEYIFNLDFQSLDFDRWNDLRDFIEKYRKIHINLMEHIDSLRYLALEIKKEYISTK